RRLLAGGHDLAQAAQQRFQGVLAAGAGLLGHGGGLAAHAPGGQQLGVADLAQHLGRLGLALGLVHKAQLHVGAVDGDLHAGAGGGLPGGLHQRGSHVGVALDPFHRFGVGQLGAGKAGLPDGGQQVEGGVAAKIMAPGSGDECGHGRLPPQLNRRLVNTSKARAHQRHSWVTSWPQTSAAAGMPAALRAASSAWVEARAAGSAKSWPWPAHRRNCPLARAATAALSSRPAARAARGSLLRARSSSGPPSQPDTSYRPDRPMAPQNSSGRRRRQLTAWYAPRSAPTAQRMGPAFSVLAGLSAALEASSAGLAAAFRARMRGTSSPVI